MVKNILTLAVFAAMMGLAFFCASNISSLANAGERVIIERQTIQAIEACYAVTGEYPESIDALKEEFGLKYDEERFCIHYNAIAANISPNVAVTAREARP